jgi:poly-gamma-glutamate synthesis protein (capsule biosynthesis protein)
MKKWKILFLGDAMCHDDQRELAYKNGTYDFDSSFSNLKDLFNEHDYVACNMESPICEPPYMGFPKFNTPVEFANSLMDVGANIFFLANNHINDRGESGIDSTINKLTTGYTKGGIDKKKIYTVGVLSKGVGNKYIIINDVAILNYTNILNNKEIDGDVAINMIDDDMMLISQDITNVKKEGAKYIIVYIHWGNEYERFHSEKQRKLAEMLVNCGVNFIIGGHPHVVEDYEFINGVPVFYSLGNFISSQPEDFRTESVGISLEFNDTILMNINCIPFKTEKDDKKYFTKVVG